MEVNLLEKKIKKLGEKQRLKKLASKFLLLFLLVLALLMIGLSSYSLLISVDNKKLEKKLSSAKQQISQLEEVETKQVYLLSKLKSFDSLIKLQEKHQAVAETIFSLVPDGTTLKGFDVEQEVITLSGSVPSWQTLSQLLSRIKNQNGSQAVISKAQVNRISFGSKGEISFEINLSLNL